MNTSPSLVEADLLGMGGGLGVSGGDTKETVNISTSYIASETIPSELNAPEEKLGSSVDDYEGFGAFVSSPSPVAAGGGASPSGSLGGDSSYAAGLSEAGYADDSDEEETEDVKVSSSGLSSGAKGDAPTVIGKSPEATDPDTIDGDGRKMDDIAEEVVNRLDSTDVSSIVLEKEHDDDPDDDVLRPGDHIYVWKNWARAYQRHAMVLSVGGENEHDGGGGGDDLDEDLPRPYSDSTGDEGGGDEPPPPRRGWFWRGSGGEQNSRSQSQRQQSRSEQPPQNYGTIIVVSFYPLGSRTDKDAPTAQDVEEEGEGSGESLLGGGSAGANLVSPSAEEARRNPSSIYFKQETLRSFLAGAFSGGDDDISRGMGGRRRGSAVNPNRKVFKVKYAAKLKNRLLSRAGTSVAIRPDPRPLVLARVEFLLSNPQALPEHHTLSANGECAAVWCRTGRWCTAQAASILQILFVGQAGSAVVAGGIASQMWILIPMPGVWGVAGWWWWVPATVVSSGLQIYYGYSLMS